MLLALKLLVVLGVLSYALAAVLGERELVVYGSALPAASSATAAAAAAAFQHPLSHFVRRPRHGHGPGTVQLPQQQGEEQLMGRRVSGD